MSWSLTLHSCCILIYGIINTSICRKILGDFRFFKGCWWNMTTNEQSKHKSSAILFFGFGCQDEEICQEWNPSLVNHNLTFCEFPWAYVILVILVLLPWENSPSLQETFFRWFKVTFCCPPVGGHLNSLWKGHVTIRKRSNKKLPGLYYFPTMPNKSQTSVSCDIRWRSRYNGQQPDLTTVLRPYMARDTWRVEKACWFSRCQTKSTLLLEGVTHPQVLT